MRMRGSVVVALALLAPHLAHADPTSTLQQPEELTRVRLGLDIPVVLPVTGGWLFESGLGGGLMARADFQLSPAFGLTFRPAAMWHSGVAESDLTSRTRELLVQGGLRFGRKWYLLTLAGVNFWRWQRDYEGRETVDSVDEVRLSGYLGIGRSWQHGEVGAGAFVPNLVRLDGPCEGDYACNTGERSGIQAGVLFHFGITFWAR